MKKILLTTSALTLLAGAAAADVSVGGYARIGVSNTGSTTTNYLRNRLTFTGSATTDGGLTFSTWQRLRTSAASSKFTASQAFSAPNFTVSNGAMALKLGNVSGAISANGGVWGCNTVLWGCADLIGGAHWASASSAGNGPNIVRVDMALGGASVSISGGNDNSTEAAMSMPMGSGSVSVGYNVGKAVAAVASSAAVAAAVDSVASNVYTPGVAAVASSAATAEVAAKATVFLGYSGSVGDMGVKVRLVQHDSKTAYMGSVQTAMSNGTVFIFAGKTLAAANNYGVKYSQSLGGGASLQAGATSAGGTTTVGAGVDFSF
jgi:outer membrane protein OmpU